MASATESSLSSKYQKMTDLEHILKKPDTYIGSIQLTECTEYTAISGTAISGTTADATNIGLATFTHIPALYKLVDEGLVNMRDHVIRQAQAIKDGKPNALPVTSIEVEVDAATGTITMTNDGNGIDIAQHPEHKMWIPEMIFGHLRTSTNYAEDKKEKIVGGKNGFGFKLVLVWSTWGSVETVDHVRGLKYTQEFKNNLTEICAPKITTGGKKPYTRISFRPDYARFGIAGLTPDLTALFKKRVYDIAAVTDRSIRVKYNGAVVPVKDFKQYICLYDRPDGKCVFETASERWEYAVCLTHTDEFAHVSFVNGICTSKGGKHVEYVMGQILRKLAAFIKTKKKVDVKPATIKEQLMLFLRCDIENPAFSSQTKDELTTTSANFGSACVVSDEFVEKVAKMGVMDAACALTEVKEAKAAKKTDGAKTRTIRGIPKLIDANFAGTEKSAQCTIIFCEGDSAKAGIVSGLSKEDRNTIGVYPVKGKFMNVRGEAVKRIAENTEIAEIKRILGLENGREYTAEDAAKRLRYGKVLFMTDQDLDGSHIKGLGINLFQSEWPSLTHIPGFIGFMNTPILKARKGAQERVFYNEGEFEAWKSGNASGGATAAAVDVSTWAIKYYKGLGTSTGREFREYFEHKKIVDFAYTGEPSDDAIDLVFNKKRADDRKQWLSTYNRADHLDTSHKHVTYEDFMTREMKHFSIYDNQRSIANGMDGLKISLRKILFAAFKKGGLKTEIKVAQFSGYVSEHSGYHHGEASLNGAIIGMAQNFVGSNNINLFEPNGQYGTRLCGGRDSASERYIFTQLNPITRLIYRAEDDAVLEYLDDDGQLVEPTFYAPIVPMVLVNGTKGIGTGFSTDIMCHNPLQIIDHIGNMLLQKPEAEWGPIEPYYRGFKGTITALTSGSGSGGKFLIRGIHTVDAAKKQVRVTELPVGYWTEDFKKHLEALIESGTIKDYVDMSTDTVVDFTITFPSTADFAALTTATVDHGNAVEKLLKLYTTESTSNMHLFDSQDQLKKYGNVRDIVRDYYGTRLSLYKKRKTHQLATMTAELLILTNKARYIQELLDGSIDLRRKRGDELTAMLQSKGYDTMEGDEQYKYLLKLPMDSVSEENVQKLLKEKGQKELCHATLQGTSIEQLWLADLAELRAEYVKQEEKRISTTVSASTGTGAKKIVKAKK